MNKFDEFDSEFDDSDEFYLLEDSNKYLLDEDIYSEDFELEAEDVFALFGLDLFLDEEDELEDEEVYEFIESHGVWNE